MITLEIPTFLYIKISYPVNSIKYHYTNIKTVLSEYYIIFHRQFQKKKKKYNLFETRGKNSTSISSC